MAKMFLIFLALGIGLVGAYFFRLPGAKMANTPPLIKEASKSAQFNPPPFKGEIKNAR